MSYKLQAAIAVAVAGLAGNAVAGNAVAGNAVAEEAYRLDDVIVTASRTAQTVDQTLAPVTVITRDDIERSQASTVTELLNRVPGLQITNNGGQGSTAGVYLRGTRTSQTLVMVDGVKINSSSSGSAPLQYMSPEQIDRIEVVRGPRSSLYGADAVGGVIQIFTRKGHDVPRLTVRAGVGNMGTGDYGINYSGQSNGYRYSLGANLYETAGYDHTVSKEGKSGDKDGYRNKSVSGSVSRLFDSGAEIGGSFSHTEGKAEYDNTSSPDIQPYNDFSVTSVSGHVALPVNDQWSTSLTTGLSKEDAHRMEKQNGVTSKAGYIDTKRLSASWQNDISWNDSQLTTAGLDYSKETIDSNNTYGEDSRYNIGVFAQHLSDFDMADLQVGLRHDNNQRYNDKTTGNVALGIDLPYDMRLIPSYGTSFRAPTFSDLYFPGSSNPDLKPETAKNMEVELKGKFEGGSWSVSVFQNDMKDMIVSSPDFPWTPENVDKARIKGLELTLITKLMGWDVQTNATVLDPENRSGAYKGKTLYRRATQLFNVNADKQFGKWLFGGTFRAQNKSWNDHANTQRVAGFATMDLRAGYQLTKELKAETKVTNLLDKEYTTTLGYRDEPRRVLFSLVWSPEL